MTISTGDKLPEATLSRIGGDGPEPVSLYDLIGGKTVAIFALPGAYTPTCSAAHVPSFIDAKAGLAEKGVHTILCIAVNDPFVLKAWGQSTGGTDAGIQFLSDADGSYTKALGLDFDAPPVGFFGRSRRYSMLVEDGTVRMLNLEESPGVVEVSGGDTLLAAL